MTITCSKVHKTSLCDDIDLVSVLKSVSDNILTSRFNLLCHLLETSHIHLAVEVTCVAADSAILHIEEVLLSNHAITACHSNEDISKLSSLLHLHHLEAIHNSLHGLDWINLSHNDLSTETLGAHCNTLSAPAVTGNNNILTCNDEVSCTVDTIPYRLACTIAVIEEMLAVSVIHEHHREFECTSLVELNETEDTCSSLLAATDHIRDEISVLSVHKVHKVTAIIDDHIWPNLKNSSDVLLILVRSCIVPCKNVQSCLNESSCDVVLS